MLYLQSNLAKLRDTEMKQDTIIVHWKKTFATSLTMITALDDTEVQNRTKSGHTILGQTFYSGTSI